MDISLIRNYFEEASQVQAQLKKHYPQFSEDKGFALYKAIAVKSQPKIDALMIRQFVEGFNWQISFVSCNEAHPNAKYQIMNLLPEMNPDQTLDFGLDLLFKQWGKDNSINF